MIKEGKDVTLARVMEMARPVVSTSDIMTGCKRQPRSIMCSMVRDLRRRRRADPDPVAAVVAAAAVEAMLPMMENPPIQKEMEENPHYLPTSTGDVEKSQHQKDQPCKAMEAVCRILWNQRTL